MSEDGEAGRPTAGTTPVAALRTWWERWRPSVTGLIVAALAAWVATRVERVCPMRGR